MSQASGSMNPEGMITSLIAQLKITKIPETPTTDQDFIVNQEQNASNKVPEVNEIFENIITSISKSNKKVFKKHLNFLHVIDKALIEEYLSAKNIDLFSLISKHSQLEMLEYLIEQREILPYLMPLDKKREEISIKNTFLNCMCNCNSAMLERYYDYLAGDLHWVIYNKTSSKNDFENFKNILSLLKEAYNEYNDILNKNYQEQGVNPQIVVDVLCIISFNEFQIELYGKLNKVKLEMEQWQPVIDKDNAIREIKVLIDIIDITISLHADYSRNKINDSFPALLLLEDADNFTVYRIAQKVFMFRKFLWKTDYNVCLLILDNLYLLKERLKMPGTIYQELESHLYYFIYNCKSKWSFYLSKTQMVEVQNLVGEHNGVLHIFNTSFDMDIGALWTFLIIYLERQDFLEKLFNFNEKLKVPILPENIKLNRSEMSQDEQQSLIPIPEMRDDFSLRKMYKTLEELPSAEDVRLKTEWAQLIVERVLQVVGEFIKSTKESKHLEATTQALMLAEIPLHIVKSLKAIRQFLSKADNCQILWRIELSKHGQTVLAKVLNDLKHIKDVIKRQISINRYLVNRSLINGCRGTLIKRRDCIRENIENIMPHHFDAVSQGLGVFLQNPTEYTGNMLLENFYKTHWKPTGLSVDLMMEVAQLQHDLTMLLNKHCQVQQSIKAFIDKNYTYYKNVIVTILDKIMFQKENWKNIKLECLNNVDLQFDLISEYPNELDVNKIRTNLKLNNCSNKKLTDLLTKVIEIKSLWDIIENILDFIINKCKVLNDSVAEIKWGIISECYAIVCRTTYTTDDMARNVERLFHFMEQAGLRADKSVVRNNYNYDGLLELEEILLINNFVTEEEILYISKNTPVSQRESLKSLTFDKSKFIVEMKHYVDAIGRLQPYDPKSEEIISNVKNRDGNLLKCYLNRLKSLSSLLNGQPKDLLILRYKYIGQFKIWLEMILIDIFNILKICNQDGNLRKVNRLLAEINLRHVLTHGSPLLEVVGDFLDANDVPSELISKALEFIKDLESVQALYTLKESKFDFNLIYKSVDHFDKQHLLNCLKKSKNWEQYLSLLPENIVYKKPKTKKKQKKKPHLPQPELITAIKDNANDKIKELINIVDLDAKDQNGKAAVHHAVIQNNIEVLTLLKKHKADLDITNQKDNNRTALHYAAMKGNSVAVDFLLKSGALVQKDTNGNTYKDIEAMQIEISDERNKFKGDMDDLLSDFESFGLNELGEETDDNVMNI
ncbi:uncharacterized protein LOC123707436 isoform X1 [Pieris brassicae]|uniref:uncharacterized protein LOC123707436 isoform X1 n=1 Tax=Pieris brassicae TaxID=7116 RepID=UPI001E65EDDF|nr:uncharacterized protein LOC123707436 isoform X1 [Pieris brassicae]XP_045513433.1 uncharacterized protein LOC123707436 isoform X1 [Pieris brassicae]XP_045513434.1 uncharacterized protein LOC123707436 isoform X1 [Pieris brassicae]